ncbi:MAG TPA: hypothetical protein PKL83_00370 [bacterium]|nr:hypothetical protein [bacterium]
MKKVQPDEIDELTQALSQEASEPDEAFRLRLRKEVLRQSEQKKNAHSPIHYLLVSIQKMFNFRSLNPKARIAVPLATALILVIAVLPAVSILSRNLRSKTNTALSDSDRATILNALFNRTNTLSQAYANQGGNQLAGDAKVAATAEATSMMMPWIPFQNPENNYLYSKSTYLPGPKLNECPAMGSDVQSTYETYYYQTDNGAYVVSISYDADGDLDSYSLTLPDGTYYMYRGGDFAVRVLPGQTPMLYAAEKMAVAAEEISSDAVVDETGTSVSEPAEGEPVQEILPVSSPLSEPLTEEPAAPDEPLPEEPSIEEPLPTDDPVAEPDIPAMFEGADVKEIVRDGVTYYEVTWSYDTVCSYNEKPEYLARDAVVSNVPDDDTGELDTKTFYSTSIMKAETLELVEQKNYINSVADENLLSTSLYEQTESKVAFADVQAEFSFTYNVPVRDINPDDYVFDPVSSADDRQLSIQTLTDFLADNGIPLLMPEDAALVINSIYFMQAQPEMKDWYSETITDRSFFPAGTKGEERWTVENESFNGIFGLDPELDINLGSLYFQIEPANPDYYTYYSIEVFKPEATYEQINNYFGLESADALTDVQIRINGELINAKLYTEERDPFGMVYPYDGAMDGDAVVYETRSDPAAGEGDISTLPAPDEMPPAVDSEPYPLILKRIMFDYQGYHYVITTEVDRSVADTVVTKPLTVLQAPEDTAVITQIINAMYDRQKTEAEKNYAEPLAL